MSDLITPNLASIKPSNGAGGFSTKDIFISLTKNMLGALDKLYDATLARVTMVNVAYGGMQTSVDSLIYDTSIRSTARDQIEKLKASPNKAASGFYTSNVSLREKELFGTNEALEKSVELLHKKITENLEQDLIKLKTVLFAQNPLTQETSKLLEEAEKDLQKLKVELNREIKAREDLDSQLVTLAVSSYNAMPPSAEKEIDKIIITSLDAKKGLTR